MNALRNLRSVWNSIKATRERRRFDVTLLAFGYPVRLMATPRYSQDGPRRSVLLVGVQTKGGHWSAMVQRYGTGCELEAHRDGRDMTNKVLWFLLWKAREGGLTYVEGPHRTWLGGRVMRFDGGSHLHGVTKVVRGSRTSLILQRGRYAPPAARRAPAAVPAIRDEAPAHA